MLIPDRVIYFSDLDAKIMIEAIIEKYDRIISDHKNPEYYRLNDLVQLGLKLSSIVSDEPQL